MITHNTDVMNVIVVVNASCESWCHSALCIVIASSVIGICIGSSVMIHLSDTARHSAMYCLFGPHIREGEPIQEIWGSQVFQIFWKSFFGMENL